MMKLLIRWWYVVGFLPLVLMWYLLTHVDLRISVPICKIILVLVPMVYLIYVGRIAYRQVLKTYSQWRASRRS